VLHSPVHRLRRSRRRAWRCAGHGWRWCTCPAVCWGAAIELTGWICPLTPLENRFRQAAGEAGYAGSFIDHYLLPILYPAGLTREIQYGLAAVVIVVNLSLYGWLVHRYRHTRSKQAKLPDAVPARRDGDRKANAR
jgi:hypothetical protein